MPFRKWNEISEEREPMLNSAAGGDSLSASRVEMHTDPPTKTEFSMVQTIRRRFTGVYIVLGLVLLIALAVLVVSLMLLYSVKNMDQKYTNTTAAGSERFMRLYEEMSALKGSNRAPAASHDVFGKLSAEQIAQARAFGLIPPESSSPTPNLGQPIQPINGVNLGTNSDDVPQTAQKADENVANQWHDPTCSIQCNKADISIPPLLVISLDGFSNEYRKRNLVTSLERLGDCGAKTEFMLPTYPSKTFPNHYTMATGLYPESHGIVDNYVYDPAVSPNMEDVRKTKKSAYFKGDPIWSAAVRQHRRMFCLMWPGCSFNITGYNPTKDIPYDKTLKYSKRIDMIMEWLMMPAEERPDMIMAYFDQPDGVGHFQRTDLEVNLELKYVESVLDYLFSSLRQQNLLDCVNIIIVSDHGMQPLKKRVYLSEHLNITGTIVANGVVSRIHLPNGTKTDRMLDQLECTDSKSFHVYDRKRVPSRFHFAQSSRIGDIIVEGMAGTIVFRNRSDDYGVTADHGYDYLVDSMRAIFFARGPNIRPETVLPPFQNYELFNLFSKLLRLRNDVPNNGTDGVLDDVLNNISNSMGSVASDSIRPILECDPIAPLEKRQVTSCVDDEICRTEAAETNKELSVCPTTSAPVGFFYTETAGCCFINLCSIFVLTDLDTAYGRPSLVLETLDADVADPSEQNKTNCVLNDLRFEPSCNNWTATSAQQHSPSLQWNTILASDGNYLQHYNRLQFLLHKEFAMGPFAYLQNLTRYYVKRYNRLLSITGAVYDFDMNGIADDENHISSLPENDHQERLPSHIIRILIRCEDNAWHINGLSCRRSSSTRILAFILPNAPRELNCLKSTEYLRINMARVRDIELLSNIRFFNERMWYPERDAIQWRVNITQNLWPLFH